MYRLIQSCQFHLAIILILLNSLIAVAQQGQVAQLAGQLESFYSSRSEEKVYLHTSSQLSSAGRQILFQAYVVDAYNNGPTSMSKVLRVELWDDDGTVKHFTQRVKIKDGLAQGAIDLPLGLASGRYRLYAYTQWMLNYGQVYSQSIVVDKKGEFRIESSVDGGLNFVAEGGHLVAGVANKVAVKTNGEVEGVITNSKGKEVTSFKTNEEGFGVFIIVPEKDEIYSVKVDGENRKYSFPFVEERALAFLLKTTKSGYRMNLQASKDLQKDLVNGNISVIVEAQGIAYFSIAGDIKKTGYFIADLESSLMPNGPVRISVFDSENNLLAERPFYNFKEETAPAHMGISTPQTSRREKVDLSIFNDTETPLRASVSITKVDQQIANIPSIQTFDLVNTNSTVVPSSYKVENLDLMMLTNVWKPAEWSDILSSKRSDEIEGVKAEQLLSYSGVARDNNGQPLTSQNLDIWLINHDQVYQTMTNDRGEFDLVLFDFMGKDDFLLSSLRDEQISIEMSAVFNPSRLEKSSSVIAVAEKDYSYKRKINQVYDFYRNDGQNTNSTNTLDLSMQADYTVDLDKYVEFRSMREMFVEVVVGVLIKNNAALRVYIDADGEYASSSPLFFVNGIPTYDQEWVLNLDPLDIDVISVLNTEDKLRKYKSIGRNGIVDIKLKSELEPPRATAYIESLDGLTNFKKPLFPQYDQQLSHSRLPDLREVLYWESDITIDAAGQYDLSFFTSDMVGTYQVKVEGMSANGRFFTLRDNIEVNAIIE